jgi:flagellar M-ring protein FliF
MDQLTKLIAGLSVRQRFSIVAAALLAGAGILAFVHWRHEGDFRPLYTSMALEDASTVVQKLRESGVEYRLADNGAAVLVPSAKLAESRLALAAAGLPKTGRIGFELFDKTNFGATEFVEHVNYKRALEGELERSVVSLAEVEQARVHLTLPKESVFVDQQEPAKASVMVKLRPGAHISPQNVMAVTHLVSSAVEGLTPEAVSVLDMDGNLLSRPRRASANGAEVSSETLELRNQIERGIVTKISETLEPLLGGGGFRAGASIDYDLTSGEQQEETLDPTHSVMVSSQKSEDVTEHAGSAGVPGTASNLPNPAPRTAGINGGVSRRTENITYQTSRIVRRTQIPQGIVRRMSLAVLVDQEVTWEGEGAARHRVLIPPSPEKLKTIRDLVAGVTGFNAERGDQLIVETLPFENTLNTQPPAVPGSSPEPKPSAKLPAWQEVLLRYRDAVGLIALGLVVSLILIRVILTLLRRRKRRIHPVEIRSELDEPEVRTQLSPAAATLVSGGELAPYNTPNQAPSSEDRAELADRVRQLAQREPAVTANVLRMWLQDGRA